MAKCPGCDSIAILNSAFGFPQGDGKCSECHGTGYGDALDQMIDGMFGTEAQGCLACDGTGICQICGGSGEVDD